MLSINTLWVNSKERVQLFKLMGKVLTRTNGYELTTTMFWLEIGRQFLSQSKGLEHLPVGIMETNNLVILKIELRNVLSRFL